MRPVSERFLRTLRGGHRMAASATVVAPGQTGVQPVGTVIPILSGSDVQIDGTAQVRSNLELHTSGRRMWPTQASSLLAPYGNEIFIRRGIVYGNGETEWVSLGYFRIEQPEQDNAPDGPIRIRAHDRMAAIIEARLLAPRMFTPTTTYGSVMSTLVQEVYPWATIEWDDNTPNLLLARTVTAEEDRHAFLNELVTGRGKIWYWDHRGILVIRTPPALAEPVWEVNHGQNGVLVQLSRRLSRSGVYNAVVVTGEGADNDAPVRAVAIDNNPKSPTYWSGNFGKVPRFFSSPLITGVGQADATARTLLAQNLGLPYSVDFTAVPNPALEPYDPVLVRYPGRSEVHVLDKLTVPLVADAATQAATREQTLVSIGSL